MRRTGSSFRTTTTTSATGNICYEDAEKDVVDFVVMGKNVKGNGKKEGEGGSGGVRVNRKKEERRSISIPKKRRVLGRSKTM